VRPLPLPLPAAPRDSTVTPSTAASVSTLARAPTSGDLRAESAGEPCGMGAACVLALSPPAPPAPAAPPLPWPGGAVPSRVRFVPPAIVAACTGAGAAALRSEKSTTAEQSAADTYSSAQITSRGPMKSCEAQRQPKMSPTVRKQAREATMRQCSSRKNGRGVT
jgi:hypothetical protein